MDVAINDLFDDITFDKLEEYGLAGAQPLDKVNPTRLTPLGSK